MTIRIAFLYDGSSPASSEEESAWSFLTGQKRMTCKRVRFSRLGSVSRLRESFDLLWWHSCRDPRNCGEAQSEKVRKAVGEFIREGGRVLFSLAGAAYVCDLGLESARPTVISEGKWGEESWAKDYPDIRGFAPFQGHPIFHGLTGGLYSWMPSVGRPYSSATFVDTVPANGKVVAVERQYIRVIPSRRIITEYSPGRGRVLCVGSYMFFEEKATRVRPHLEAFVRNCFSFLNTPAQRLGRSTYWSFDETPPRSVERTSAPVNVRDSPGTAESHSPMIARTLPADSPGEALDVGGRRCVVLSHERRGVREVWCHPVRILKDVRLGFSDGSEIVWTDSLPVAVEIRPESITRSIEFRGRRIIERTYAHPDLPAGCISLTLENGGSVRAHLTAEIDLRMMWPLDEFATGPITYAWDEGLQAAVVATVSGEIASIFGTSTPPALQFTGNPASLGASAAGYSGKGEDRRVVRVALAIDLTGAGRTTFLCFAGSAKSERDAELSYRAIARSPLSTLGKVGELSSQLLSNLTTISVSDHSFNDAYRWALSGTDRFYLETSGLGSSFVAGFGTVERGWDGGHKVSGRPGYAWYFGRDAVWTAFAALGYGDFEKVRGVLEFLGRHQDLSGKILHELTTSGFAHFDAADSTPLYIILFGRYVRSAAHKSFARGEFARLRKAVEFCFSTDTDGDGLIENTNVGHGWVEGGGLFPVHTEHYLASCWREALSEAAFVASVCEHPQLAKKWERESQRVHDVVVREFWNPATKFIRFGKKSDGTYNEERTLLPAVGLSFGVGTSEQADACLDAYASSDFTSDWGVRIIGAGNPMFNPSGYHYGSVWPLFTGWAALAEFKWHRPLQGFMHAMSTALTYKHYSAGWIEEVMRGDVFQPAGVCPHQAWSESMVLQPLLDGMLGIVADGMRRTLRLSPWIPPQWSTFTASRIRTGQSYVTFTVDRGEATTSVEFRLEGRQAVQILFDLRFPLGTEVEAIDLDGKTVGGGTTVRSYADSPSVSFRLSRSSTLTYKHRGGIGLVPPLPDVVPGSPSHAVRVINERFEDSRYIAQLEGSAGSTHDVELIHRGSRLTSVEGADTVETYLGRTKVNVVFDSGTGFVGRTLSFKSST